MPRFCIKISDTVVFGVPRSACTSRTVSRWNSLIATGTRSIFSGSLLVAGLPECESLPTDSQPFLKHFCHTFICATLIALSPKAFWIIWTVTAEECSNLMQNWMHFHCSTRSVILNAMATQYTCSRNGVYRSRWLVQWSHHCSHTCIPVHSPWLPGYVNITQIILIILTMARLFLDRPRICQSGH